jgi:hypothetical protein
MSSLLGRGDRGREIQADLERHGNTENAGRVSVEEVVRRDTLGKVG